MAFAAVTYSQHARERMNEQRISPGQVENTLYQPDTVTLGKNGTLVAERRTSAGNLLRVIYAERLGDNGNTAHGVTVIRMS